MIAELILFVLVAGFTVLVIVNKKNAFATRFIANLAAAPPSKDSQLEDLLGVAARFYAEKNYLSAEKAYLRVLKIDHKNSLAYSRLGFIYSHLGNSEDAIECFEIVADTYPNAASFYNLAMMYFKIRDFTRATKALEKSLEIEMHFSRLIVLARIYRAMDKFEKQLLTLQKAHEIEPSNIEAMQLLAEAYVHDKNIRSAKLMFAKILRADPKNLRAKAALQNTKTNR